MKILIIHFSGIGNTIMMFPLLHSIYKSSRFDDVHVLFRDQAASELIKSSKIINKIYLYQNSQNVLVNFFKRLWTIFPLLFYKFDYIVNTEIKQSFKNKILMRLLRSRNKICINNSWGNSINYIENTSEIKLYKKIGEDLKINWQLPSHPFFRNDETKFCKNIQSIKSKKIGVHVGSGENMIFKRWPAQNFSKLLSIIEKQKTGLILFFGGKEEIAIVKKVINYAKLKNFFNFCGKLNITTTAQLISNCDVFVSNDSGLLHLASSMGVPVIGLYGPTSLSKNRPFGNKKNILIHKGPCKHDSNYMCLKCKSKFQKNFETPLCLKKIKVEEIYKYLQKGIK